MAASSLIRVLFLNIAVCHVVGAGTGKTDLDSHEEVTLTSGGSMARPAAAKDSALMRKQGKVDSQGLQRMPVQAHAQELLENPPHDTQEKRVAPDGQSYTKQEFIAYFGEHEGEAKWNGAVSGTGNGGEGEKRIAPDGKAYTKQEFIDYFGEQEGQVQWTSAGIAEKTPQVNCGGHAADRCRLCTVIDPNTGLETADRGPDWCHGDCTYYGGECHTLTSYNLHVEREASEEGATTTQYIPDLLNPKITDFDQNVIDMAADRSIQEADYEAKMKLAIEKKKEEEEKDKMNKFIYAAVMAFSGCMLCGAACACVALCRMFESKPKKSQLLEPGASAADEAES